LWGIILVCLFVGGLFGWITNYIYAALMSWTGKWLKGNANTNSIIRVLAHATIPSILSLPLLIPQIGIYGVELFKSNGDITSAHWMSNVIFYGSLSLNFVFGIYTIVLLVIGISEVQKFSIGYSILNLFLPILVLMVPIFIIALVVGLF
jgi:hypothetical protein